MTTRAEFPGFAILGGDAGKRPPSRSTPRIFAMVERWQRLLAKPEAILHEGVQRNGDGNFAVLRGR